MLEQGFVSCPITTLEKVRGLQQPPKDLRVGLREYRQFQEDPIVSFGRQLEDGGRQYLAFFGPPKVGRLANCILTFAAVEKRLGQDRADVINDHMRLFRYLADWHASNTITYDVETSRLIRHHQRFPHWHEYAAQSEVMIESLRGAVKDRQGRVLNGVVPFLHWQRNIDGTRSWIGQSPDDLVTVVANNYYGINRSGMVAGWGAAYVVGFSEEVRRKWPKKILYRSERYLGHKSYIQNGSNQAGMYSLMNVEQVLANSLVVKGLETHIDLTLGSRR